jgi:DNA-binding beta-propeller fold protein YncE
MLLGSAAALILAVPVAAGRPPVNSFVPLATYQVAGDVAEIVAATPDGMTLIYTDSEAEEIGFVDITDPAHPEDDGTLAVAGSPTSVSITPDGAWAIAAVDTSDGDFVEPSGELLVIDLGTRGVVRTIDVGGQPDAVAVAPDGTFAAVAVENQRDEELGDGGLPQAPAGFLLILELDGGPAAWTVDTVDLTGLPGLTEPSDPEPEFADINANNVAAVTLQENNAVALVDLASRSVVASWSAGISSHAADTIDDDVIAFMDTISEEREPDAIAWTPAGNLLTANEGDWLGGSRDFTIFRPSGEIVFDAGASLELAAVAEGLYPDGRSDNKGVEPEGVEVGSYGSHTFAFVGAERAAFVAVYRLSTDRNPRLVQLLRTGSRPEGLLAIPARELFVTANEGDGTISIFGGRVAAPLP